MMLKLELKVRFEILGDGKGQGDEDKLNGGDEELF